MAAVLALGGLAEIGGFVAARGIGAVAMGAAIVLTVAAGAALAASSGPDEPKQRLSPRGGPVSQKTKKKKKGKRSGPDGPGGEPPPSRRADGAPEIDRDTAYFDRKQKNKPTAPDRDTDLAS